MVQEALRRAARSGAARILIQAGSAAAWAQWNMNIIVRKKLITEKNYPHYQKSYHERCAQFDKIPKGVHAMPTPGEAKNPYHRLIPEQFEPDQERYLWIYDKSKEKFHGCWIYSWYGREELLNELYISHMVKADRHEDPALAARFEQFKNKVRAIGDMLIKKNPRKILTAVDQLVGLIVPGMTFAPSPEKIKYLQNLPYAELATAWLGRRNGVPPDQPWLADYLRRFGYEKIIMAAHPEILTLGMENKGWGPKKTIYRH